MDTSHFDLALKVAPVTGMIIVTMFCCYCAYACKKFVAGRTARRNIVVPEPATEMQPVTYEEVLQLANAWSRRRRQRRRGIDIFTENASNDKQDETTGDSNTRDSSNDNENKATRNIKIDRGKTSNLGEKSNVISGIKNQKVNNSNVADDSVKSGRGNDKIAGKNVHRIHRV